MNLQTKRPAIAMIELIFALVIMGIVLMSAPQLIATATKSGFTAIQQEAINEAASQVNMIMGYHWDENDANESFVDPILTTNGYADLNEYNHTARRKGTPLESYRTFVRSDGAKLSASTIGTDTGETIGNHDEDDIDDFNGTTIHLISVETSTADNVETTTIDINTTVYYSTDTVSGGYNQPNITYNPFTSSGGSTTNIKTITVTLTSNSTATELNEKKIILRAFSCNIGGYKLEEKDF